MNFTNYTETCCQVIQQEADSDSDYLIPHFVYLQKFADDVNRAFDYDLELSLPELDTLRIEILAKFFDDQLTQLQRNVPVAVWRNSKPSRSSLFLTANEF